jgi:ethanolamine utilization protein EutN
MEIGQVIGTVVSTRKHERLVGSKIQVVQRLEPEKMTPEVLIARGSAARKAIDNESAPVDATIVGIIDEIDIALAKTARG